MAKFIRFLGKAAHAGGAPDKGINALNAASLALTAIHYQRETFRDQDHIRVHPILTRGGETVNIVPRVATMETFVRGATIEADRGGEREGGSGAARGGDGGRGGRRDHDAAGLPAARPERDDGRALRPERRAAGGRRARSMPDLGHRSGSTDMGDLSQIMPAIHPYAGGARGQGHGSDYEIVDYETAAVVPAKAMAMTVIDLLADGASTRPEDPLGAHAGHDEGRSTWTLLRGLESERTYRDE